MPQRISYLRNETLPTVRPGYPGNKLFGREFANGEELFEPSFANVLKWQLSANPQKEEKKRDTWAPKVVDCAAAFSSTDDMLVWLGHSSFLLRVAGVSLLFDPVLFSSLGLKHRHPLPCPPEAIRSIDYLLLSHGHRDHCDEKSIKLLAAQNPQMQVLSSLRMAPLLRGMAPALPVQEAGWWQQYDLGPASPLEITYLPASHWHRRGLTDLNQILWGSFMIRVQDKLIYFAGDTAYAEHFEAIEARLRHPVAVAGHHRRGESHNPQTRRTRLGAQQAQRFHTIDARHVDIHEGKIRQVLGGELHAVFAAGRGEHLIALGFENVARELHVLVVVFDDEDGFFASVDHGCSSCLPRHCKDERRSRAQYARET